MIVAGTILVGVVALAGPAWRRLAPPRARTLL
jgi:hypothetical protein